MDTDTFDGIVIGSGITGLAAAATLADAGHSVVLLEKSERTGGSTAMAGGWFAFSGTEEQRRDGIEDDDEQFLEEMRRGGGFRTDEQLLHAYVNFQPAAYRWLKDLGLEFGVLKISSGQSVARSHHVDIHKLMDLLRDRITAAPGSRILTNHRARRLVTAQDGTVTGVEAAAPGGDITFSSRGGVVLASGGFSRGSDLLEIFAPEQLAGIPYGGPGNTGDGLKMAWRLGAGFRDMGYISGTYGSHPETGDEEHELLTAFYMGAIIVNESGQRFVDESESYKKLGAACLKQPNGMGFQVFDSAVRAKSQPGVPLSDIDHLEAKGRLFKADSIAELAVEAGIDADALAATVSRYNYMVKSNSEDDFGRSGLCNGVGALVPIEQGPFYAYPAKTLMTSTYCGLTVTPRAEVTSVDGTVIEGLYAAGELVGGFHGTSYMTGTALSKGLIFGKVAGEQVQARATARQP